MAAAAPPPDSEQSASRRATDAMVLKFNEARLRSAAPADFAEGEVETIDLDSVLPPGSDAQPYKAAAQTPELTPEQKKLRLQLVKFKQSFDEFTVQRGLSRLDIDSVKRGDVIEIKTVVGSIYLRLLDRIRGEQAGAGEILCECRYDLGDQCDLAHAASIQLPLCSHKHVITAADGSQRLASRALKISSEAELPPQVTKLLHEHFFTELILYANPQPEKLRLLDIGRWLLRIALKIKSIIDENNRREREKEEAKRRRKEEKRQAAARARQAKDSA